MNLAAFRAAFPEFQRTGDDTVNAKLALALNAVDASTWGADYDSGHGHYAAHLLATSPTGQQSRLSTEKGVSTYLQEYERLAVKAACGYR